MGTHEGPLNQKKNKGVEDSHVLIILRVHKRERESHAMESFISFMI
jgi:hypothetical protein